ncbi:hypothetical protein ACHQM5_022014 [Ranunculus cassubicifolius]
MRILGFESVLLLVLLLYNFSSYHVESQVTDTIEVTALESIRGSLNDPMKYLRDWDKGDPCMSNWTGVYCFNSTRIDGYLHVRELMFLNMNLSGTLSPDLGKLSYMENLDFMWNKISGSIPKEIGNITSLKLLLLNGNQLTGSLPEELGYLSNLDRIQIDQNYISGPLPKSFANLRKVKHFHMNNNSISGQIPSEISKLPVLYHVLLDNNNLSGYLPPELSELPRLRILQLDNNHFTGTIPSSYGDIPELVKLSLRNCSLQGVVPDLSRIPNLGYLDLSWNQLKGSIPSNKFSDNITTIDLSYNRLGGPIPTNFSGLPHLQKLSLKNNSFSGVVPSNIWQNRILKGTGSLLLDFQNNALSNISDHLDPPANASIKLHGNPVCQLANQLNIVQFCKPQTKRVEAPGSSKNTTAQCFIQSCPEYYEYVEDSPVPCFCAAPIRVGYRLKSPVFSDFLPYVDKFKEYVTSGLHLNADQLYIDSFEWEVGPRLRLYLKLFPEFNNHSNTFSNSQIKSIRSLITDWATPEGPIFGPYELLNFTLLGPYANEPPDFSKSGISKGSLAGITLGLVAVALIASTTLMIFILRRKRSRLSRKRQPSRASLKIEGVKAFTFEQMAFATNNFSDSNQIGQGGYGKVYRGSLSDGTIVAVKRALEGSLQGEREFLTEIELLSRVHHRNLVSLLGYCDEADEQMLVYEFMENGTLRDHLSVYNITVKSYEALSFPIRIRIALDSAKGILYLHTEADPPIFHRDIKATNILLDSKFTAKVADFGLSKLAPVSDDQGVITSYISTVVKGTPGYLDPEYFLTHILTDKSDVYSLGVVFLELLTGMQAISHGKNIVREVNLAYKSGAIFSMIDSHMGSYSPECVERFVRLALNCCQDETDSRPSMADVVRELDNIWFMMPESDIKKSSHYVDTDSVTEISISSSFSGTGNRYTSSDLFGSGLVSGESSTYITPR